jgi:hypothetical protein
MGSFVGVCPDGHTANHKNGKKTDNRWPANLEYMTSRENWMHAYRNGKMPRGETCGNSRLTEEAVREIRQSIEPGKVLAQRFGVNKQSISQIRLRISWRHII